MKLSLGIKSDPVQYRYSYEWLFGLMKRTGIQYLQLGSFFEMLLLEDEFFLELREKAEKYGIRIKSIFSAYREMAGFYSGNAWLEKTARTIYEKYIHIGSILGSDYVGTCAGSVNRDSMDYKERGIQIYLNHMKELIHLAKEQGLKGLSMEVMSCSAEPPSTPKEIDLIMGELNDYHQNNCTHTVPAYLLGDISHGFADIEEHVINSNYEMFEYTIPYMNEFHFKNTDTIFHSTFGFSRKETEKGSVDLSMIKKIIERNTSRWPVDEVTGYLEHPGPKLGRDYTDYKLEEMLTESIETLQQYF